MTASRLDNQRMKTKPSTRTTNIGVVMSNFDNTINLDAATRLDNEPDTFGSYSGWDLHGTVWKEDNKYHAEIRVYRNHVDSLSSDSLQQLMTDVCESYGYD